MIHCKILKPRYAWSAIVIAALLVLVLMVCVKNPVQKDNGNNGMTLTLEDKTSTTATFSGEPITAFIAFHDSVFFDDIAWHLGSGKFLYPAGALGKKIKVAQVKLVWDLMPLKKDSATGKYYDSIYISKGGELFRSNTALVFVTNLAPVIDSIKISNRTYLIRDTIRDTVRAYDTLNSFGIRIFAHDLNQNALKCSWLDGGSRISFAANSLNASFLVPRSNYTDTIHVSVYDGLGGSCDRVIYIVSSNYHNRPPFIDSVRVKDSVFFGPLSTYYYATAVTDSITFRVFARDSDVNDNISIQWTDKNTKQIVLKPKAAEMTMVWACTSSSCKAAAPSGNIKIVDTVTVIVRDNDSAVASKSIIIIKGYLGPNKPPVFDSLRVNDTMVKGAWTILRYPATCRDSIRLRMFGHDPDSADTVHWKMSGPDSTRLKNASDTAALYLCKDSMYRDTLTLTISDMHLGSVSRQVVIDVNNRYPVLDSIRCLDTLFKTADSLYVKTASTNDSLPVRLYCHDPDAGDSVLVHWSYVGAVDDTARFKKITGYQAMYICKGTLMNDTFGVNIVDKRKAMVRKRMCVAITNHPPSIDSIQCGDSLFKSSSALYARAAAGKDSLPLSIFVHDPDVGDSASDTVFSSAKVIPDRLAGNMKYRYVCKDSTYTDTLSIVVKDTKLKSAVKKVKLSVTKK